MWRAWLDAGCLDHGAIRTAISAGAPLSAELERAIYERSGIKVHNFYGSSECGGIAYDRSDSPREHPDVVGSAMCGVEVSTADDGCLCVEGAAVASRYWPEPEPETLSDQRFCTRDLATIDGAGTIRLTGRAGDLINIAGRKLDPAAIEAEILRDPAIDQCIVFGIQSPDPERVHEIVAITSSGDPAALSAELARRLPAWQRVRHWWVNPDLAPNARGKLSRAEWRQHWRDHHHRDSACGAGQR
jgi:acyl-coenzyme A synthetase/AMP-(fatty) acid ligase